MFASQVKKAVMVGDIAVTIRKLSGRSLDAAMEIKQQTAAAYSRALGGDLIKAFSESAAAEAKTSDVPVDPKAKARARYNTYDRFRVLQAGVVSWVGPTGGPALPKVTEGLEDLEESAAQFLFEAIVDLSVPSEESQEEATGKD